MGNVFFGGGKVGMKAPSTSRLPKGYTELTYIQSGGTQYIDTGFKPNQNSRIDMVAKFESVAGGNSMLFGVKSPSTAEFFVYHNGGTIYGRYANVQVMQITADPTQKALFSLNKNSLTVGEETVTTTASTFQCTQNAILFGWNENGAITPNPSPTQVYSCQIYDNGNLIRDFVPCLSDADGVGMYDLVESKFYGNAGTGGFIGGEEVA